MYQENFNQLQSSNLFDQKQIVLTNFQNDNIQSNISQSQQFGGRSPGFLQIDIQRNVGKLPLANLESQISISQIKIDSVPQIFENTDQKQKQSIKEEPQVNQPISPVNQQKKRHNHLFKHIFKETSIDQKSGNTIRFLVDLAVTYLPNYLNEFSPEQKEKITERCSKLRTWHLKNKMNVYKLDDLCKFFGDQYQTSKNQAKKSRKAFKSIIRNHSIQAMKRPRSQIKNKVFYLKVAKLFGIRCANSSLSQRVQSR